MRRFAKDPLKQLTSNGFQPHNGLLDPFFYKVAADATLPGSVAGAASSGFASAGGYAPLTVWGDMDPRYRGVDKDLEHGRNSRALMASEEKLGKTGIAKILQLVAQLDKLYNPPVLDAGVLGFAVAVAQLNAPTSGVLARAGVAGAPAVIPRVDPGTGGLIRAGGEKLYGYYADAAANFVIDTTTANPGPMSDAQWGALGRLAPSITVPLEPLVTNPAFPVRYAFMTDVAFANEDVDADGLLAMRPIAPSVAASTRVRVLSAITAAIVVGANTIPAILAANAAQVLRGISRVEIIRAPKLPYGLSSLASAIMLNAADRSGQSYNPSTTDPEVRGPASTITM